MLEVPTKLCLESGSTGRTLEMAYTAVAPRWMRQTERYVNTRSVNAVQYTASYQSSEYPQRQQSDAVNTTARSTKAAQTCTKPCFQTLPRNRHQNNSD